MKKIKFNKSKTYLLPLLSELINFDKKFLPFLENTFLLDTDSKYKNCICILHEFNFKNPEFTHYEHALTNNELFVELHDIGNKVLYVFNFPDEYLHEYNKLLSSEYSQFGLDAKELILEFWTEVHGENPGAIGFLKKLKQILFKEEELKKELEKKLNIKIDSGAELGDHVYIENETFNFSTTKKEINNNKVN